MDNLTKKNPLIWIIVLILAIGLAIYFFRSASDIATGTQGVNGIGSSNKRAAVAEEEVGVDPRYQIYSKEAFEAASDKRRVYFFHASWCPTCRVANQDLLKNINKLPNDVVIFKIDYDSNPGLKKKYGVTYQHTFVQVDANEELVKIWNGGGVAAIAKSIL